ncbi:MAG: DUF1801 domain-containing protein [Bacteroides sp.]|nr:DUF1801 domain-containing protein [Bacteroides sp.]
MQIHATTPEEYISQLPEERKAAVSHLRKVILDNLPEGFEEVISYGMISYVVPHAIYPGGYHVDPRQPLPFISIASQKNTISIYHMGIYAAPDLLNWFTSEYARYAKVKLDMGKSCIRFKKPEHIPFDLIGQLAAKMTPAQWIEIYQKELKR